MNFYSIKDGGFHDWVTYLRAGHCCANAEAILEMAGKNAVENCIFAALMQNRTLLFWHVLDLVKYQEWEEKIVMLPATTYLGQYKNKRSGRTIRSYVTNLQQEW